MANVFIYFYDYFVDQKSMAMMAGGILSVLVAFALGIAGITTSQIESGGGVALYAVAFSVYMLVVIWQIYKGSLQRSSSLQEDRIMHQYSRNSIFWMAYILVLPVIFSAYNMVVQRRDVNFNWASITSMLVFAITALTSEAFNTFSNLNNKVASESDDGSYSSISNLLLYSAIAQMVSIVCTNQSSLHDYGFDNMYFGLCISIPIMLAISLFQVARLATTSDKEKQQGDGDGGGMHWLQRILCSEVVARTVFTLCVMYDLRSLSVVDYAKL